MKIKRYLRKLGYRISPKERRIRKNFTDILLKSGEDVNYYLKEVFMKG